MRWRLLLAAKCYLNRPNGENSCHLNLPYYSIFFTCSIALFILEAGCDVLEKGENTFEEIGLTLKIRGILPNFHI